MTSPLRWFTQGHFSPKNDVMTRPKMASSTVIPSKLWGREKFHLRWTLESNYLWQALDVLYIMDYWLFDIQPIYYLLTWHLKSRPCRSTNSSPQFEPNNNPIVVSVLLGRQVGVGLFKLPQTTKRRLRWDVSETAKSDFGLDCCLTFSFTVHNPWHMIWVVRMRPNCRESSKDTFSMTCHSNSSCKRRMGKFVEFLQRIC